MPGAAAPANGGGGYPSRWDERASLPRGTVKVPNQRRALGPTDRRLAMYDATTTEETKVTVGLDLGDRYCQICVLDEAGEVTEEGRVATKPEALRRRFCGTAPLRIVLEAGTH